MAVRRSQQLGAAEGRRRLGQSELVSEVRVRWLEVLGHRAASESSRFRADGAPCRRLQEVRRDVKVLQRSDGGVGVARVTALATKTRSREGLTKQPWYEEIFVRFSSGCRLVTTRGRFALTRGDRGDPLTQSSHRRRR